MGFSPLPSGFPPPLPPGFPPPPQAGFAEATMQKTAMTRITETLTMVKVISRLENLGPIYKKGSGVHNYHIQHWT